MTSGDHNKLKVANQILCVTYYEKQCNIANWCQWSTYGNDSSNQIVMSVMASRDHRMSRL